MILVCAGQLFVPVDAEEARITSIEYKDLSYMSDMLASEIVKLKKNDPLDLEQIDQAILALYNQGYFEDVYATFKNGDLVFHFKEKPRIAGVEIKGYGTEKEKENLYTQMGIKKGDTYDENKLDNAKYILKAALEQQGFYGSVVETQTESLANGGAYRIVFHVNRGNHIYITKSNYEGREQLKPRVVESLSANKQRDFMGWMWGLNSGKLHLNELEYDSMRIQDVYLRHGFLDVNVSAPFLNTNFATHKAKLYYKVKEGIQYRVSGIEIQISKPVISIPKLLKGLKIKKGMVFNIENMRADAQTLKREVADKGYAFAVVKPDLDKDEQHGKVKVIYRIETGDMVYINDIIISGNQRTSDRVIRREVWLNPKERYSLTKVANSENALRRLGFFSKVKIEERRVNSQLMDLLVNVEEGRTGQLQFGLGYGSYGGLMLNGSVSEKNLFGTGQSMSLYANVSTGGGNRNYGIRGSGRMFSGNLTLRNPRIFDSRYSSSISLFAEYIINYNYIQQGGGFSASVGRMITNTFSMNLGYNYSINKIIGFSSPLYEMFYSSKDTIIRYPNGQPALGPNGQPLRGLWDRDYHTPTTSSFTLSTNFDNTDDYYFPKNGFTFANYTTMAGLPSSNTLNSWNGLGGNVRNAKIYGKFAAYHHLQKYILIDLIARFKTQGGYIFRYNTEDYLPLNSVFYLGGVTTVRGFRNRSITPRNAEGMWVGGDGIYTGSVELSYGLLKAAKMRVAWFFDWGFLTFKTASKMGGFWHNALTTSDVSFKDYGVIGAGYEHGTWRASTGIQIEWISPMGPLVLIFPIAFFNDWSSKKGLYFNTDMGDLTQRFEFSMGTRF
ncbi:MULTISPECIES: outer membrane protein assembly factor BamA [Helicobacter]|uniref:outer membrane protein assembly factor BamA n=1 Tax=Helicobacter TaxID=209 RepID=UPI0019690920|nr:MULTISPECIES: outer membrane protein assembly factor BamA [Helicobacter]